MMRVLFAFILLLGAIYVGLQLHTDSGYVLISFNHWTIESTFWVAALALLCLFGLLHFTLQLVQKIMRMPSAIHHWHQRRLAQKAQAMTRKGLIEYSEGYWQKAKTHLVQALPNTDAPLINYLTAARAAQKMGDSSLRDHYLREAQQSMPEAKVAVELTQAELQLANHQWEQALATLRHLQVLAPHHPYVLKLLMHLYEEVRDWTTLIALLPDLKKYHVINAFEFDRLQQHAYLQSMMNLSKHNQTEAIKALFASLPKSLANNTEILAEYVGFLIKNNDVDQAEYLLRRALRKEFNTELIQLYGSFSCKEERLTFAQSLLKKNPHSAELYFCLGTLCVNQQLWGNAKDYLEQSLALKPLPATCLAMGILHEQCQTRNLAYEFYKNGLILACKKP